jgi:small subunit ribosomal protein S6
VENYPIFALHFLTKTKQKNMLNQYETTFILTPVLSEDDAKSTINSYVDLLKSQGAEVIHQEHWGLKNLRYPIDKKTTGIYHLVEYKSDGKAINPLELAFRRDETVLRYLTVKLDKYAVKYNDDKRAGLVGRGKKVSSSKVKEA